MDQQQEVDTTTKHAGKACFYGNVMMLGRRKNCLVIKLDGGGSKACSARHLRKTKPGAARMPLAALDTTPQAARRRRIGGHRRRADVRDGVLGRAQVEDQ